MYLYNTCGENLDTAGNSQHRPCQEMIGLIEKGEFNPSLRLSSWSRRH